MISDDPRVSLADLSAAGVRLRAAEAVTIVRELIQQVARGSVPGMPSAHVIRLSPSGQVTVEGPVAAGGRAVSRAATLLEALLPPFDAPHELRAPGALRIVVARALGTLDVPTYESLEDFSHALQRFSEPDAAVTIRRLTETWARAAAATSGPVDAPPAVEVESLCASRDSDRGITATALARRDPASLTVSDIRRARRATGLPLVEISMRSRIPVPLLRQLEWGYLHNWPTGLYGRTQLVRYARASGLDEQLVTATVWPMLEEVERERAAPAEVVAVEAIEAVEVNEVKAPEVVIDPAEVPLQHVEPAAGGDGRPARGRRARRVVALFGAAAMLALLTLPGLQDTLGVSDWRSALSRLNTDAQPPASSVASPVATNGTETLVRAPESAQSAPEAETPPDSSSAQDETPPTTPASLVSKAKTTDSAAPASGLTDAETAWSPTFATVGSAMFYHAQDAPDGRSAILRADTDDGGAILRITRVVDDNAKNFHARPSPEGSRIAFDSDRDGERGVYVADSDGGNVRRVSGDGFAAVPSWSPDGRTLAFVRAEPDRPRVWNVWLADLESGDLRRLTSHRYGQPWGASWFPDGRRVAYSHEDRLVVLELDTGRERVYASPRKGRLIRTPAVSPDGERIMFQVYRDGAWLLNVAEGSMRKVLADPTAEEYAWSPDGRRVAYHSRRSGQWGVWLMLDR
jgi:hypothetical protein